VPCQVPDRRFEEQAGFSDVEEFLRLVRSLAAGDRRPERRGSGTRHRGLAAALLIPSYFLE